MPTKVIFNNEIEKAYARHGVGDDFGEYSYLYTECKNYWYSVNKDPMYRNGCRCPKCGKIVRVIMPDGIGQYNE